jgi:membrane protease YdiL (CAAX protease family)
MVEPEIIEPQEEIKRPVPQVWGPWSTVGFGLAILIVSLIVQVILSVIFLIPYFIEEFDIANGELFLTELPEMIDMGLLISISIIISAIVCTGLTLLLIKARRGETIIKYLGLKRIGLRTGLIALAVAAGFILLSVLVNLVFKTPVESDILTDSYFGTVSPALFWIAVAIFGPIFEEILFRGFLFEGFRYSRIGAAGAIIVTSVLWAGSHLQYGLFQIAWIFVLGVALGLVRYRTGSLWAPILMHIFNNMVAILFIALELGI